MMKPIDYKEIYQEVVKRFKNTDWFWSGPFDETFYTLRVYETAKEIMKLVENDVDREVLLSACILHDVGKARLDTSKLLDESSVLSLACKEGRKHAELGVGLTREILSGLELADGFIEKVCHLVRHHNLRGKKLKNRSLELKILQDADLIADWGISGFVRPFLFAGRSGRSTVETIRYLKENEIAKEYDELNLGISKEVADKQIKRHKHLTEEAYKLIKSDLLQNG